MLGEICSDTFEIWTYYLLEKYPNFEKCKWQLRVKLFLKHLPGCWALSDEHSSRPRNTPQFNGCSLSKAAFTQGGQFLKTLNPIVPLAHYWQKAMGGSSSARPAHLSENGGFIGRLVLLLLLGSSLLHLLPVCLLFPVSSLWLQMQSTGVQLVLSGQR